jgi:hypothetical protein
MNERALKSAPEKVDVLAWCEHALQEVNPKLDRCQTCHYPVNMCGTFRLGFANYDDIIEIHCGDFPDNIWTKKATHCKLEEPTRWRETLN